MLLFSLRLCQPVDARGSLRRRLRGTGRGTGGLRHRQNLPTRLLRRISRRAPTGPAPTRVQRRPPRPDQPWGPATRRNGARRKARFPARSAGKKPLSRRCRGSNAHGALPYSLLLGTRLTPLPGVLRTGQVRRSLRTGRFRADSVRQARPQKGDAAIGIETGGLSVSQRILGGKRLAGRSVRHLRARASERDSFRRIPSGICGGRAHCSLHRKLQRSTPKKN